jgi:hypothetical protein
MQFIRLSDLDYHGFPKKARLGPPPFIFYGFSFRIKGYQL